MVIDKELVRRRFSRAADSYDDNAIAQQHIADKFIGLLKTDVPDTDDRTVVELGAGTGCFTAMLCTEFSPRKLYVNDISDAMLDRCLGRLESTENIVRVQGDAEFFDFCMSSDMIVSCSVIQWFNNLKRHFERCCNTLPSGGILAFATFGPDNMKEVRDISCSGLKYFSESDYKDMLSGAFDCLHCERETFELEFDRAFDILKHMKQTGVNAANAVDWGIREVRNFCSGYEKKYSRDGKVVLTYDVIYYIARKR